MSTPSDDQSLGEVKRLLRRLEMVTPEATDGEAAKSPAIRSEPVPVVSRSLATIPAQVPAKVDEPSAARTGVGAVPLLVANTVMATATVTSLAWYLVYSSALDRRFPNTPTSHSTLITTGSAKQQSGPDLNSRGSDRESDAQGRVASSFARSPAEIRRSVASVEVPAKVEVATGAAVRLPLRLEPKTALQPNDVITILGLPTSVVPSKGSFAAPNRWTIPANAVDELELRAGEDLRGAHEVMIELRSHDGERLASARLELASQTAQPSPGPRPTANASVLDEALQRRLYSRGQEMLTLGHIGSARILFERVALAGNADAAIAMGDTYDPKRLMQLRAPLNLADIAKATQWYERADELGSPAAKARITDLAQK